jgi:hypothetical protein
VHIFDYSPLFQLILTISAHRPLLLILFQNDFYFRALYEASLSTKPELAYLTEAIGHASDIQAQTSFQVKALLNDKRIKACGDFEEKEGRINCDLLSRLIFVRGPLIQPGPSMQDQLVKQVFYEDLTFATSTPVIHPL